MKIKLFLVVWFSALDADLFLDDVEIYKEKYVFKS